ncbi:hypothetical protein CPB85DRAFT_1231074 [Mucidula mucida]|nr:hypothetical protein CPB85DRAFT_1231074 [Mucidula mucida]
MVSDIKVNVLIHSVAEAGPLEPVGLDDGEKYLEAIQFNLTGALWVAQAFLRHAAPDAVANPINSMAAHLSPNETFSCYSVAKLAVYRLWDTVAQTHPNLSVFHTQPGVVLTELNLLCIWGAASFEGIQTDDVSLPASFYGFLASPEARFLNRKFVWCNWDVDELKAQAKEIEAGTKFNIGLVGWPFENGYQKPSEISCYQ